MEYVNIEIHVQNKRNATEPFLVTANTASRRVNPVAGSFSFDLDTWSNMAQRVYSLQTIDGSLGNMDWERQNHIKEVRDFGKYLFDQLISGKIREFYDAKKAYAEKHSKILRLRLILAPLELGVLPWELLFDDRCSEYLCLTKEPMIVLIRNIENVKSLRDLNYPPPLRIVGMWADPRDRALVGDQEEKIIREALDPLIKKGQVDLDWKGGKYSELMNLRSDADRIDIFHFTGHGRFDEASQQGYLEFENDEKKSLSIPAESFRICMHDATQLVVLNACETGRGDQFNHLSSIAHSLARGRIPSVVAMQFNITNSASHQFAKTFYTRLARGTAIDEALAQARYNIRLQNVADKQEYRLDWAAPLLYVSSSNMLSFRLTGQPEPEVTPPELITSLESVDPLPIIPPLEDDEKTVKDVSGVLEDDNEGLVLTPDERKTGKLNEPLRPTVLDRRFWKERTSKWKLLPLWAKIVAPILVLALVGGIFAINFKNIGGVDLSGYCSKTLHYENVQEVNKEFYCSSDASSSLIDMTQACDWGYSKNNLVAETNDHTDPLSWHCYTPQTNQSQKELLGGVADMDGYCRSLGYDSSSEGNNADDWTCTRQPQRKIDTTQACNWQHHRIYVQPRVNNNKLECYSFF
jgi:hypothetical protein